MNVLSVLSITLIISLASCDVHYWTIDDAAGELVSSKPKDERISCYSKEARDYTCVDSETLAKLKRQCKKNSSK